MASPKQKALIHILAAKIWGDDSHGKKEYRLWLVENWGVESAAELDSLQASEVIRALKGQAPDPQPGKYYGTGKRGQAGRCLTMSQAKRIEMLERLLDWDSETMNKFVKRQIGEWKPIQMIRLYEAQKIITGLHKLLATNRGMEFKAINRMSNSEMMKWCYAEDRL